MLPGRIARDESHNPPDYYHADHLGTPRLITNSRHERVAQPNYYPYGEEVTTTGNQQTIDDKKFTGHQRDTLGTAGVADDIDYMHARFYSPLLGRFLSTDPLLGRVAAPTSWNRYTYVEDNPVNKVDADGQQTADAMVLGPRIYENVKPVVDKSPAIFVIVEGAKSLGGVIVTLPEAAALGGAIAIGAGTGFLITQIPGWNELVTFPAFTETAANFIVTSSQSSKKETWDHTTTREKPEGMPRNSKPIDKDKRLDRETIHKIKDDLKLGPRAKVFTDSEGNVWYNEAGKVVSPVTIWDYPPKTADKGAR